MSLAIKFDNNTYIDSTGIYDIDLTKPLNELNSLIINLLESATWTYLCTENETFTLTTSILTKYESLNDTSKKIYKFLSPGTYTASNSFYGGDPELEVTKNAYKISL